MKKQLLILALLAAITLAPIRLVNAPSVTSYHWVSPTYQGNDEYFDTTVTAYTAGSTAKLLVTIYNDLGVKAEYQIKVFMSWATSNVSSDEVEVENNRYHTFEISVQIPETSVASNLYLHSYQIFYQFTFGTPVATTYTWVDGSGTSFAVYSSDQSEIVDAKRELGAYYYYPTLYLTAQARKLFVNANAESNLASQMYDKGDFASSLNHYQNALNYTKTGITTDIDKMTVIEDSALGVLDSLKGQMSMFGYGCLMFGLGFILIGIGAIVYAFRKPKLPA